MKETRERVCASAQSVGVQCPGLSWDQGLVEDAVADWNDQCLEALVDWDGDGVATERMGKQSAVGDWDLCAFFDLDVLWQEAPAGASREELSGAALIMVDVDASAWRACAADNVD